MLKLAIAVAAVIFWGLLMEVAIYGLPLPHGGGW